MPCIRGAISDAIADGSLPVNKDKVKCPCRFIPETNQVRQRHETAEASADDRNHSRVWPGGPQEKSGRQIFGDYVTPEISQRWRINMDRYQHFVQCTVRE